MKKNKNKKLPLVSIVLNCHNAEKFLERSISSVIKQKYRNWELIIFDNCSNDNTKIELLKFKNLAGYPKQIHRDYYEIRYFL